MSFTDIIEEFSGCNDQTIIKGKRSKRPRPSSSDESLCNSPEEDDEDMANCLILLARGAGASQTTTNNIKPADNNNKFTSRKFTETSVTAAAAGGGGYVYECKTCSRAFPSFQALGGHRASHKKPKILVSGDADRKKSPPTVSAQSPSNGISSKSHECSVCGSEFGSGQALGGHMRRHRSSTTTTTAAVAAMTKTISEEEEEEKKRIVVGLDLDLNLPAPTEDGHDHDQHHRREIEMGRRWWIATTEAAAGLTF